MNHRSIPPRQRPIKLALSGANLLLSGRFEHWKPIALVSDDGETGVAQLLIDATSPRVARRGDADLFSFASKAVRSIGERSYAARGTFRAGGTSRGAELLVQSPDAHTAFFFLTVPVDRGKQPGLWDALTGAAHGAAGELEMSPRAWLRPPVLAAA